MAAGPPGPLHGLTVLDLSSMILGPMTGQYLGDMGADVVKVEGPEGDVTRSIGPRRAEGMGALFLANNRNKRSIVLDLKAAQGQAALRRLADSGLPLRVFTASVDERLDESAYIVPGLGDAGDRQFGAV